MADAFPLFGRLSNHKHLIGFATLVALLVYASELSTFTLSIDEEVALFDSTPWTAWAGQGRWAAALLTYLAPPIASVPFLSTAIFCAGLCVSGVVLATHLTRSRYEALAFATVFISSPIWPHLAEFNTLAWVYGIGLILVAAGVAILSRGGLHNALYAGALGAAGCGMHQSLLIMFLCGSLVVLAFDDAFRTSALETRKIVQASTYLLASWAVAIVGYFAMTSLVLAVTGITLSYVDDAVRVGDFLQSETAWIAMDRTVAQIGSFLFGTHPIFLGWGGSALLITWVGAVLAGYRFAIAPTRVAICQSLIVVAATALAFLPSIASAGLVQTRSFGAVAIIFALGASSVFRHAWFSRIPSWALLSFTLLTNAWISSALFFADAIARERDEIVAVQLATRIGEVAPPPQQVRFTTIGLWRHAEGGAARRVETFGVSFFEHDSGNVYRIALYLRLKGITHITPITYASIPEKRAEIEKMPVWPAKGAVAMVGDVLVIKLSPPA